VLYARKEDNLKGYTLEEAKSLESIGVVRRDVREFYLEQLGFSNLSRVSNHAQNVRKALAGRISAFAYDPVGLGYICKKLAIATTTFQPVLVLKTSEVYIMMSRHGTRPETTDQWHNAVQALKEDGTLDRITRQWADRVARETGIRCTVRDGELTVHP
jgi:polar amino acid transport system substrate-binding protein